MVELLKLGIGDWAWGIGNSYSLPALKLPISLYFFPLRTLRLVRFFISNLLPRRKLGVKSWELGIRSWELEPPELSTRAKLI
jgi:hypothetical protein